jgi:hypothetical protein
MSYIDAALTQLAIRRPTPTYIGSGFFPEIQVEKLTGKIWRVDPGNASLIPNGAERAPTSRPHALYREEPDTIPYAITDKALFDTIATEETVGDAAVTATDTSVVNGLKDGLMLNREVAIKDFFTAKATAGTTPSVKYDVYDNTAIDPITHMLSQFSLVEDKIGRMPNVIGMTAKAARAIMNNPHVKDRFTSVAMPGAYNTENDVMAANLSALLGGVRVLIAQGAVVNTARKKETASVSDIWGKDIYAAYVDTPSLRYAGFGVTLRWKGGVLNATTVTDSGMYVTIEELNEGRNAKMITLHDYASTILCNASAGLRIPTVLT